MKIVQYFCDICGRELDRDIATINGDMGREHYGHVFSLHLCYLCYKDFVNGFRDKLTEEKKEYVGRI